MIINLKEVFDRVRKEFPSGHISVQVDMSASPDETERVCWKLYNTKMWTREWSNPELALQELKNEIVKTEDVKIEMPF